VYKLSRKFWQCLYEACEVKRVQIKIIITLLSLWIFIYFLTSKCSKFGSLGSHHENVSGISIGDFISTYKTSRHTVQKNAVSIHELEHNESRFFCNTVFQLSKQFHTVYVSRMFITQYTIACQLSFIWGKFFNLTSSWRCVRI
jgi:hypothetical protein